MTQPPIAKDFVGATGQSEKAKTLDQQMQAKSLAVGNLSEEQVSGVLAVAQAQILKHQGSQQAIKDKAYRDILLNVLLQQIEELNHEIEDMEAGFAEQFGDAWREELALRILGEDDIPAQQAGESIEQYRERLETVLIDEMLHDDGSIKAEYRSDPELRQYAEWAQKNYHRDAAQAVANDLEQASNNHPQTQMILDRLEEAANSEINISAAKALEGHEEQKQAVLEVDDRSDDISGLKNQSDYSQDFFKPIG